MFCEQCRLLQSVWLDEEYKEPEVDWSKVEVDTPLLVGLFDMEKVRYFAYYKDDVVYCWDDGKTARISTGKFKDDNYIDLCGYAACAGEIGGKETNCFKAIPEEGDSE